MSEKKVVSSSEYVINLRRVYEVSRTKRAKYSVRYIRKFVARHLKVEIEKVKISQGLNLLLWSRGIEKPPRKIHIVAEKYEDGTVSVNVKNAHV